ncbi:cation:proton antiporter [Methylopila turkensis]|uniref:Sodium:proton antiporter n=1 Tax=Methylopila turkensis TaxID=1437816 RepID=A0A9W6JJF3_9HYPH|nr:cation:proton antiporter [Methylopila turkensis]GLK78781.1 sodium:proton antiporter [Methylopila turkensis]
MPHETPLISTLVAGFVLAFVLGALANRLKLPPLVGYLVAGVLVGPHTPGYVADQQLAPELAEIGVILLMFGVGLHFSLKDLLSVRGIAVPGAVVQMGFATLLGWGLGMALGWSHGGGLVFGLALSVASTVVLLKALQERRLVESERGKIAVGWLIVEDLAMVLALVLIPAVASIAGGDGGGHGGGDPLATLVSRALGMDLGLVGVLALTLVKVAAFVAFMLIVGRRVIPAVLHRIAHTGSRELFRLGVLAIALGVAFGAAKLFGVSLALGAFFAGMILSESELSHRAAQESLPLRDAFAVLFFVSVGMLFDPTILLRDPGPVVATFAIIVIGKSLAAFLIVIAFNRTVGTALTISASLAQIGEFSFILAELGVGLKLLPEEGRDLILAGALLSIVFNPIMFVLVERLKPWLEARIVRGSPKVAVAQPDTSGPELDVDRTKPLVSPDGGPAPAAAEPSVATVEAERAAAVADEDAPQQATALSGHIVLVGYGRVGALVGEQLKAAGVPFLVVEDAEKPIAALKESGAETIVGNAAASDVLALAGLDRASRLVVAIPNAFEAGQVVEQARKLNPNLVILARAHAYAEIEHLEKLGANEVIMGEREIARGMLERLGLGRGLPSGPTPDRPAAPPDSPGGDPASEVPPTGGASPGPAPTTPAAAPRAAEPEPAAEPLRPLPPAATPA